MNNNIASTTLVENKKLVLMGLVIDTFGNASSRAGKNFIIKPSGVDLSKTEANEMSVVELISNKLIDGKKPSSDTPTHLEIYRAFESIGGITHTHSLYATAWSQAVKPIPCLGTTHADYWKSEVPVTRPLTSDEIKGEYELETGKVIVELLKKIGQDPLECPGVLVAHHGPFTWGRTVEEAVKNAEILEYIAKLAWITQQLNSKVTSISIPLHQRHFCRKHGHEAYYGQGDS